MEKLVKALSDIQNELKVPKTEKGKDIKYSYRSAEGIYEKVKPLLNKRGLGLTLTDELVELGGRVYVKSVATLTDGTNSTNAVGYAGLDTQAKFMNFAQATGSSSSYARKYALGGLFLLDDNKDPDEIGVTTSHSQAVQSVAKQVNASLALQNAKKAFMDAVLALGVPKERVVEFVDYYGLKGNTNVSDWQKAMSENAILQDAVSKFLE